MLVLSQKKIHKNSISFNLKETLEETLVSNVDATLIFKGIYNQKLRFCKLVIGSC